MAAAEAKPAGGAPVMTAAEREAALELLCSADLLERVTDAFGARGVVGERDSALAAWLTLTSRLSDRPLGAVVQSSSAAGKSTLADAALALVPPEAKVAYSAMTGQALYYLGDTDLAHKVLAIAGGGGVQSGLPAQAPRVRRQALHRRRRQRPNDRAPGDPYL